MNNLNALVLNADHRPITRYPLSTMPMEKVMSKVLRNRVIVLEEYDTVLRSQHLEYRPPSVIALKSYIKRPQHVPFTRLGVFLRDGFRCQYCNGQFESNDLTFDHVVPRAKGGGSNWENIVAACGPCNSAKGHRTDIHPIRKPREPEAQEMLKLRQLKSEKFHKSWMDYLYW
ncbi:MAG: HNH endonuclease, partial [Roseibium sp.]|uniref:HNH endonuclease n=1 Tax=Roseibium sp. TaxID=1936156 RepID=UPI003296EABF